jgi:hypothetical protein
VAFRYHISGVAFVARLSVTYEAGFTRYGILITTDSRGLRTLLMHVTLQITSSSFPKMCGSELSGMSCYGLPEYKARSQLHFLQDVLTFLLEITGRRTRQ